MLQNMGFGVFGEQDHLIQSPAELEGFGPIARRVDMIFGGLPGWGGEDIGRHSEHMLGLAKDDRQNKGYAELHDGGLRSNSARFFLSAERRALEKFKRCKNAAGVETREGDTGGDIIGFPTPSMVLLM